MFHDDDNDDYDDEGDDDDDQQVGCEKVDWIYMDQVGKWAL
jgi:hypothetical protein